MASTKYFSSPENSTEMEQSKALKTLKLNWNKISLCDKQTEFNHISHNVISKQNSHEKSNSSYLLKKNPSNDSSSKIVKYLNDFQNELVSLKAELSWELLKNEPDLMNKKYFLCLPTLNKNDKAFIGRKITGNNGLIKTSLNDVDFLVVNEGVFNGEENYRKQEQIKIFTYMNATQSHSDRINQQNDIRKSFNFIHEGNYKSRIARLVTQAPKKQEIDISKNSDASKQSMKCTNIFSFLFNEKWKILTLNDLYDVINRQESLRQSLDWFRKRLRPQIKEFGEFNYKALFCVASFYKLTDG